MSESLRVDVMKTKKHLLHVISADWLTKGARIGNIIEELAARDHFLSDICYWDLTTTLVPDCVFFELVIPYYVFMSKLVGGLHLLSKQIEGALVEIWVVLAVENLKREFVTIWISP